MSIWLNQTDLENATSVATVAECFNDANTGVVNAAAVTTTIDRAEQEVLSWMVGEYGPPPLSATVLAQLSADTFLKYAALEYAVAYMFDRHPEYVRTAGKERFSRADERMIRVLESRQRPPTVATKPANVGGTVVDHGNRIYVDSSNGSANSGDY